MKRWFVFLTLAALASPSAGLASQIRMPWSPPDTIKPIVARPMLSLGTTFAPTFDADALRGARYLGPARLGRMSMDVAMQMRDEAGLLRYARLASNPRSLYYRRFLTPQQLGDFFGASQAQYRNVMQYFWSHGLLVRGWTQRQTLRVVGSQANMERALSTHFGWFQKNGVTFFGPVSAPRFSTALAVRGVSGIVNFRRMHRHIIVSGPFRPAAGVGQGLIIGNSPFDLAAAFDFTGAYNISLTCCKGDGITVGIVGTGPISAQDAPFFRSSFNVSGTGGVTQVNATDAVFAAGSLVACCYSTGLITPPAVTGSCAQTTPPNYMVCNPEDIEAQLDTEQETSLAPDAAIDFYLAYNPNECYTAGPCSNSPKTPALGIGETDDELQQLINDNVADVVAASYGVGELDLAGNSGGLLNSDGTGVEPDIFAALAAEGIATFVASGDSGAEGCQQDGISASADLLCAVYPASDPNVTAVGGTTTPIGTNGRLIGPITAWGVQTQSGGGGGGGFSQVFARPAFEPTGRFCADTADANGVRCDSTHRLLPDVSLNADVFTGDAVVINCGTPPPCGGSLGGGLVGSVGGTSASAQDMAPMWALVLEACKQTPACNTGPPGHTYRLGNAAPLLHQLSASDKAAVYYDVVYGNIAVPPLGQSYPSLDPGFHAKTGFDLASGHGAPFARNLIHAITGM